MKFSGHETFHIREGWLYKGLSLVENDPEKLDACYVHDLLGVGSNMAKSIKHWLAILGLTEHTSDGKGVQLTSLGRLLYAKDPHCLHPLTWWILHANLVLNEDAATSWHWLFNFFFQPRFDRDLCAETLRRYLQYKGARVPSKQTLDRDIACLLSSYARAIPEDPEADPEESYDCPFQELGLINFYRETGFYQFASGVKHIPPHALGYVLSKVFPGESEGKHTTVPLNEAATTVNSPGKCFLLSTSELFELVESAATKIGENDIALTGLAANRLIRFRYHIPEEWVAAGLKKLR